MFELDTLTPAKLASVNVRSELHGAEAMPAVDLRFVFDAPNDILAQFSGHLLSALYHHAGPDADENAQAEIDGVEAVSNLPNLRMPKLGRPLKWEHEGTGYACRIEFGTGGRSNVELEECKVNAITIEPKEGGTVTIGVRVQCAKALSEKVLGKLASLVQHDVEIVLAAPDVGGDGQGDIS